MNNRTVGTKEYDKKINMHLIIQKCFLPVLSFKQNLYSDLCAYMKIKCAHVKFLIRKVNSKFYLLQKASYKIKMIVR